jgi:hypothetical protein
MFSTSRMLATVLILAANGSAMTTVAAMPSQQIDASAVRQVSVQVKVPVSTAIGATVAQTTVPVVPHCGPAIPRLAAALDELLPTAQLSPDDLTEVTVLRGLIEELALIGKEASARDVEEVAMNVLGYDKVWLRCGAGTFNWLKRPAQ